MPALDHSGTKQLHIDHIWGYVVDHMGHETLSNHANIRTFETDDIDVSKRFDYWQQATNEAFLPLESEQVEDSNFSGRIQVVKVGHMGISAITADAQVVRRSRKLIRCSEVSSLFFICQTTGIGTIRQDCEEVTLNEGDLTFVDSDRPYEFRFDNAFEQAVLQVPKDHFLERCRWIAGSPPIWLDGKAPLTQMVSANLKTLLKVGAHLPQGCLPQVFDGVIDLLSSALGDALGETETSTDGTQTRLQHLQRAKRYILKNLKEESLSPDVVAQAGGISGRYLRNLFSAEGQSVSAWIRMQRLESARMDLQRKHRASIPVNQIAYRWGFSSYTHFCRLFKSTYGVSPTELRRGN